MSEKWSTERINDWYDKQPWLVGCNYIPGTAINQLEMWQEETFDPETIDRELSWAAGLGMNTARVYLHDVAWTVDREGFMKRVDRFLSMAARHGIRPMLAIFDDCWYPDPKPGRQPEPRPGIHNSGWLQSPGIKAAVDRSQWERLEAYVKDVVTTFGKDGRVLVWDLYNELGNIFLDTLSLPAYRRVPKLAALLARFYLLPARTLPLFKKTVEWARSCSPEQPLTASVWFAHPGLNREVTGASDIISFHNYKTPENLEKQIEQLKKHGRPILCTEYLARNSGSRFETFLPIFKREKIGCWNWGLVSGKTQTVYSWADQGGGEEPEVWYHDIYRPDGNPFSNEEVDFIRKITAGE